MTDYDLNKDDWRSEIDPDKILSDDQRHIVHASLKSIMDKSSNKEGVSTLLILSPNEETAVKIAQCLLKSVNTEKHKYEVPTEIDLRSHRGGKLQLDKNLRSLLSPGGSIRAVLLRHIDDQSTSDAFDRTRLLFAYCDGENPVVPHRLIIMTATSTSQDESELRENFKTSWPNEHDYVDALMSRISGHTLFVEKDQKSIC
ncbi:hypothetical protein I4U23_008886 [Adineta vaga]|nr:hypothetical protein I4U23_008886 [Adineta vaga]